MRLYLTNNYTRRKEHLLLHVSQNQLLQFGYNYDKQDIHGITPQKIYIRQAQVARRKDGHPASLQAEA